MKLTQGCDFKHDKKTENKHHMFQRAVLNVLRKKVWKGNGHEVAKCQNVSSLI